MRTEYVITIYVDARDETDLRKATDVACDRITSYDPSILILDSDVDYAPDKEVGRELN
jgi:hypothetical protein